VDRKRYQETARLLDEGLSFRGPFDNFSDRTCFLTAVQRLAPIVTAIRKRKTFVDGPDVCVIYDMVTEAVGTVAIAEWYRIGGDKIRSIVTIFDARPFGRFFGTSG